MFYNRFQNVTKHLIRSPYKIPCKTENFQTGVRVNLWATDSDNLTNGWEWESYETEMWTCNYASIAMEEKLVTITRNYLNGVQEKHNCHII
jgi:hypothetical protein